MASKDEGGDTGIIAAFTGIIFELLSLIFESIKQGLAYIWEFITGVWKNITDIIAVSFIDFAINFTKITIKELIGK